MKRPTNWFVIKFKYQRMFGLATYVKSRNGGASHYKRITGPMSFDEAVRLSRDWQYPELATIGKELRETASYAVNPAFKEELPKKLVQQFEEVHEGR